MLYKSSHFIYHWPSKLGDLLLFMPTHQ